MSRIVIIGAGNIGGSVAEDMAKNHELTVIDRNAENIERLRARMDALFLVGPAESPDLLDRAGCNEAEIILAVTESDMTNLAASHICKTLYDPDEVCKRIIRIRNPALSSNQTLLEAFGVTIPYNPEDYIANTIAGVVEHPGSNKLLELCDGAVKVAMIEVRKDSPWQGRYLAELYAEKPSLQFQICTVQRGNTFIDHSPTCKLEHGDKLVVSSLASDMVPALQRLRQKQNSTAQVFVAGGGPIGEALAQKLEKNFSVTLFEPDPERCAVLARKLSSTLVCEADPTDSAALRAEDVESSHYFCAVSETDETNIMSALLAKQLGCANAAVLVNRYGFEQVLRDHGLDTVVSPSEITSSILKQQLQARSYAIEQEIGDTGAKIIVINVHSKTKLSGQSFNGCPWPPNVFPCALVRSSNGHGSGGKGRDLSLTGTTSRSKPKVFFPNSAEPVAEGDQCLVYISDGDSGKLTELADIPFDTF